MVSTRTHTHIHKDTHTYAHTYIEEQTVKVWLILYVFGVLVPMLLVASLSLVTITNIINITTSSLCLHTLTHIHHRYKHSHTYIVEIAFGGLLS